MFIRIGTYGLASYDANTWQDKMRRVALVLARAYNRGDFDAVAVQGSSGVSAVFAARALLPAGVDFPIIIVRKDGEDSHSGKVTAARVSGSKSHANKEIRNIVVLDDLVASGDTVMRIVRALNEKVATGEEAELVRVYTYDEWGTPRHHSGYGFEIVAIQ